MDVKAIRNEDTGHVELGVEEDGHFVALATMPTTSFDAQIANQKAAAESESGASS